MLSGRLPTPPVNVGVNSTPNYGALAGGVQQVPPFGMRVFAGQRDEGFYVDLAAIFDLLQIRRLPGQRGGGVDGTRDSTFTRSHSRSRSPTEPHRPHAERPQRSLGRDRGLVHGEPPGDTNIDRAAVRRKAETGSRFRGLDSRSSTKSSFPGAPRMRSTDSSQPVTARRCRL